MIKTITILLSLVVLKTEAAPIPKGVQDNPCQQVIPWEQHPTMDIGENCKYEIANSKLPPATDQRVIYFGDSLTEGWLNRVPGLTSDVLNRGIGGQTSNQMLVRFRADVLNLKPRIVHLIVGTNDIAGNKGPTSIARIKDAIMSMTEQARSHGIKVILGSLLPAKRIPWNAEIKNSAAVVRELNQWLESYAAQQGFVYADYFSALTDGKDDFRAGLAMDGIHPTYDGYSVMNPIAIDALRRAQ